jgi:hypothetical protein
MKGPVEIADTIELLVWANDQSYSQSELKDDLEAGWPQVDPQGPEDLARQVFEELFDRAGTLGKAYPFLCNGNVLRPRQERKGNSSYLFCLGLTYFEAKVTLELRTREFEGIVSKAAESYFGGKSVRIGAPWATQKITSYKALLQMVSDLIPELGPPIRETAPGGGDAGWDIVLVRNFADDRFSRIIALGNCATGLTNWKAKGAEVAPTLFWSYFKSDPASRNPCLTFFAVPFQMTDDDKLSKAHHNCITFDRLRICEHSPNANKKVMKWLEALRADAQDLPLL